MTMKYRWSPYTSWQQWRQNLDQVFTVSDALLGCGEVLGVSGTCLDHGDDEDVW